MLVETLLGAAGALLVLLFVFASFLALLPLLIAAVSILTTFMLVLGLTTFSDVSFIVQFLIALIGLGVAIDYSLLLVSRWREERAHGRSNEEAVVVAMKTAGHAVMASGVTVAISLLALLVVPVPALRSMGIGGHADPARERGRRADPAAGAAVRASGRASTTRGSARRARPRAAGRPGRASSSDTGVVATGAALVMLGPAHRPGVQPQDRPGSSLDSLATSGPPYDALHTLTDGGVGTGVLTPIEVLVAGPATRRPRPTRPARSTASSWPWSAPTDGDQAVVDVVPGRRDRGQLDATQRGRRRPEPPSRPPSTARCGVTGARRDRRGLLQRGLRQVPLRAGPDRADHLRAAGADVPVGAAAAQGRAAQPGLAGGGVRRDRVLLAAGPRLRRDLQRVGRPAPSTSGCRW